MISVQDSALERLKASIQNRISTNSSLECMPMGCTRKTSRSRTVSLTRTNVLPSENVMTSEEPSGLPM